MSEPKPRTLAAAIAAQGIKPIFARILIKRDEELERTEGGIIIPDNAREAKATGEVVAIFDPYNTDGGGMRAPQVAVGDHVMFGKYSGSNIEVEIGGIMRPLLILPEGEILMVLKPAATRAREDGEWLGRTLAELEGKGAKA